MAPKWLLQLQTFGPPYSILDLNLRLEQKWKQVLPGRVRRSALLLTLTEPAWGACLAWNQWQEPVKHEWLKTGSWISSLQVGKARLLERCGLGWPKKAKWLRDSHKQTRVHEHVGCWLQKKKSAYLDRKQRQGQREKQGREMISSKQITRLNPSYHNRGTDQ